MISFMNIPLKQYATGDRTPHFDAESVIEFRNVSFKYPGSDKYALHNMNIIFRGDEKLCIVGINGSGKSTFIKLLTRLYFPTEGEILLNGVNINEYDYTQYQRLFTPVFQDFQLYSLSLAENIILADEYDQARLDEVCLKCGLSELIKKLPKKGLIRLAARDNGLQSLAPSIIAVRCFCLMSLLQRLIHWQNMRYIRNSMK